MATTKKKSTVKKKAAPKKMGRPKLYNQKLASQICAELAEGKSLRSVLGKEGMPSMVTVFNWLNPETGEQDFIKQYTRAKQESADALADDIQDIGARVLEGVYDPASARVAIESYKWVASKLKPKKYGDKLEVDSNVKHSLSDKSEEDLNKLVQDYLKGNKGAKTS